MPDETRQPQTAIPPAGNAVAAAALLAPPVAVFAPLGMAPLLALLAATLLVVDPRQAAASVRSQATLGALLALLSLWGAVTSLWSPIAGHSLFEAARLAVISIAGLVVLGAAGALAGPAALRPGRGLAIGIAAAVILLQLEHWGGKPVWHLLHGGQFDRSVPLAVYDRGVTVLLLAGWPLAAVLAARRNIGFLLVGIVAVGATLLEFKSQTAVLAAAFGIIVALAALRWPRSIAALVVGGVLMLVAVLPLLTPAGSEIEQIRREAPALKTSAVHRLVIWRFVADRIADRPLLGWGMDASRAIPGGEAEASEVMPQVKLPAAATVLPLHPHDAALQWRLELGLPGAVLCLVILGLVLWRVAASARIPPAQRALALGYAASVLTVAMLSFGAWQAWWLSTIWLTASFFVAVQPRR
ncbi:MAG TPA: O-antigen ligase family protein [Stellaceae bacterium]|nr:O-antigen ligase family protein [Stellaceae bacterium]